MAKAYSSFDMDAFMKGRKLGAGTKAYSSFAMEEGPDRFKATAGKRDKDRDGVPADRIARDDRGNLIYNSEAMDLNGRPYSFSDQPLRVTGRYDVSRKDGTTEHAGIDLAPGTPDHHVLNASALSVVDRTVSRIDANGFGTKTVIILSRDGTYWTYGHLASRDVNVGNKTDLTGSFWTKRNDRNTLGKEHCDGEEETWA